MDVATFGVLGISIYRSNERRLHGKNWKLVWGTAKDILTLITLLMIKDFTKCVHVLEFEGFDLFSFLGPQPYPFS